MPSYQKIKSVGKDMLPKGKALEKLILDTMSYISSMVGGTLGPGGQPVLIERQEYNMPNMVTKDGVTVFRHLGFDDPIKHAIMETARDAAMRTATEAGDGTTTATVISEAVVRYTHAFCKANPKISPQKVVRTLQELFKGHMEGLLNGMAIKSPTDETLRAVAKCSANGEDELADAIMECFDLAGDDGNITILEKSGPSGYEVEALKGYPVTIGYEDSCRRFFPMFINDKVNNRIYLEKPLFILYFGTITEIQTLYPILGQIGRRWTEDQTAPHNVVIVATSFSESVLSHLSQNFTDSSTINVVPLLTPKGPIQNWEMHFLQDLSAVTGSSIFDPISNPVERAALDHLGSPLEYFEESRYRSNIVGRADEDLLMARVDEVKQMAAHPEGELEKQLLEERIGKLTGGIAKLTVSGASNGEIREKRDRAEDAACAVRGARKHGCFPGAGWAILNLIGKLGNTLFDSVNKNNDDENEKFVFQVYEEVLEPALSTPLLRLMSNAGLNEEEIEENFILMAENASKEIPLVWNGITGKFVDPVKEGIVDSLPAVMEAIRNSFSIATLLGTLGAVIVFKRDKDLERSEAKDAMQWIRDTQNDTVGSDE